MRYLKKKTQNELVVPRKRHVSKVFSSVISRPTDVGRDIFLLKFDTTIHMVYNINVASNP